MGFEPHTYGLDSIEPLTYHKSIALYPSLPGYLLASKYIFIDMLFTTIFNLWSENSMAS